MTGEEIWKIALQQSAYDCNCSPEDFLADTNTVVLSQKNERARKYLDLPFACDLVCYGHGVVAQVSENLAGCVAAYLRSYPAFHCFEPPNLHVLSKALRPHDLQICFLAEYFLPDPKRMEVFSCGYELRVLEKAEFAPYYTEAWSNALCKERQELDVLAIGAYEGERLIGLAGCSADCETMYQIGVDVHPNYRKQGIASALTSHLAQAIFEGDKVPFYCAAWSNLASVRNAIRCGFRPAWVECTARKTDFVDRMNSRPSGKGFDTVARI